MTVPYGNTPPPIDDDLLSAYLDGALAPTERERVRRAIQTDETVRERYRTLAATVSLLRALPPPAMPRSFTLTPAQVAGGHEQAAERSSLVAAAAPAAKPRTLRPKPAPTSRLIPLFGAFSAIAAILLIGLITADFGAGAFRAATPTAQRTTGAAVEQDVPTTAPAAARAATNTSAQPATVVPSASHPSATTRTDLPLALVRAVEIALAIVTIAGLVLAVQGARARPRYTARG